MELRLRRTLWAVLVAGFSMMSFTAAGETQFTIGTGPPRGVGGPQHCYECEVLLLPVKGMPRAPVQVGGLLPRRPAPKGLKNGGLVPEPLAPKG